MMAANPLRRVTNDSQGKGVTRNAVLMRMSLTCENCSAVGRVISEHGLRQPMMKS